MNRLLAVVAATPLLAAGAAAQESRCSVGSLTKLTEAFGNTPKSIAFDVTTDTTGVNVQEIGKALGDWKSCVDDSSRRMPTLNLSDGSSKIYGTDPPENLPEGTEVWVWRYGRKAEAGLAPADDEWNSCGMTRFSKSQDLREVWVFSDAGAFCRVSETRRHELGHPLRLDNTTSAACRDVKSIMYVGDERRLPRGWSVQGADCDSAEREFEIDNPLDCDGADSAYPDCQDDCTGDGEESGGASIFEVDENGMLVFVGNRSSTSSACPAPTPVNPCDLDPDLPQCQPDCEINPSADGCPVDCSRQPSHPDCDCSVNPSIPCPSVEVCDGLWQDRNGNGKIDQGECMPNQYSPIPNGGGRRTGVVSSLATGSSGAAYSLTLAKRSSVALALTGMTRDFDCRVVPAGGTAPPGKPPPDAAEDGAATPERAPSPSPCSTNAGTQGDSWSGALDAGTHAIQVWPFGSGAGNFTLAVSFTELEDGAKPVVPTPPANPVRTLPFADSRTVAAGAGEQSYTFKIPSAGTVGVALTKLSTDFDCYVMDGATKRRCTNRSSTTDDSWSRSLDAGVYSLQVYAWRKDAGSYTVSVSGPSQPTPPAPVPPTAPDPPTPDPDPEPDPEPDPTPDPEPEPEPEPDPDSEPEPDPEPELPAAPALSGRVNVTNHILTWTTPTSSSGIVRYQLQAKDPARGGWHFPSGGSARASSLGGATLTWNIVTPASLVRHYRVRATNDDGDGPWSSVVVLTSDDPPAEVSIVGSVSNRTQTVRWSAPRSDGAITKYQLQTRSSASASWRWPGAGSPTASNIPSKARSWSVTTAAGLTRHYRVRAVSALGAGAWSSHVELTSASPSRPPLSAPDIPNFSNLPSRGRVNTLFPVATGGTPPYRYRLSGLPPGITFNAATRVASGTLPTVNRNTTYRLTYSVTDSAGATDSDSFTATVVPP